jgi:hypothetical protein
MTLMRRMCRTDALLLQGTVYGDKDDETHAEAHLIPLVFDTLTAQSLVAWAPPLGTHLARPSLLRS